MKGLPALALAVLATPALACPPDAAQLFVCGTGADAAEGYIEMCDITGEGDETDQLQFEMQTADGKQFRFPDDPADGPQSFFFSHSNGPGGYLVNIRFADGDTNYRLYSLAIPPDPAEDDAGGGDAGVEIVAGGGTAEIISCGERPYMFISYLRNSMSCDLGNPLGEAGCSDEHTPIRTVPLGESNGAPAFLAD